MAENTEIAWTDHTFNPVKGCQKVSEGCKHCYAEAETKRYGLKLWGPGTPRERTSPDYWKKPRKWNQRAQAAGVRERVFVASWADVGEDHPDWVAPRRDLARLIEETPALDWLLLTKRPENFVRLFRDAGWSGAWPDNVWAGCTVENQAAAHERIPRLLKVPARVRFLSCEPLIEAVDLDPPICDGCGAYGDGLFVDEDYGNPCCKECSEDHAHEASFGHWLDACASEDQPGINWVIVGGESGPSARPFDLSWARALRNECDAHGVPFFFKQAGSRPLLDGAPLKLAHRKGGDLQELPEDLRIREWPETTE